MWVSMAVQSSHSSIIVTSHVSLVLWVSMAVQSSHSSIIVTSHVSLVTSFKPPIHVYTIQEIGGQSPLVLLPQHSTTMIPQHSSTLDHNEPSTLNHNDSSTLNHNEACTHSKHTTKIFHCCFKFSQVTKVLSHGLVEYMFQPPLPSSPLFSPLLPSPPLFSPLLSSPLLFS